MKKLILLFIVATFISCDTKTLEINKEGGSWNAWDESGVSKKGYNWI